MCSGSWEGTKEELLKATVYNMFFKPVFHISPGCVAKVEVVHVNYVDY